MKTKNDLKPIGSCHSCGEYVRTSQLFCDKNGEQDWIEDHSEELEHDNSMHSRDSLEGGESQHESVRRASISNLSRE